MGISLLENMYIQWTETRRLIDVPYPSERSYEIRNNAWDAYVDAREDRPVGTTRNKKLAREEARRLRILNSAQVTH